VVACIFAPAQRNQRNAEAAPRHLDMGQLLDETIDETIRIAPET
jgi:hypothetical protein